MEEEKKKKEKVLHQAREQAKQNFEKVQNQPGLKELQDKIEESKMKKKNSEDDDEEQEQTEKKKK